MKSSFNNGYFNSFTYKLHSQMFNVFSSLKFFWKRKLYILDIFYVSNSDTYNINGVKKGGAPRETNQEGMETTLQ